MEFNIVVNDSTYKLIGGGACPEQYDVHDESGNIVGYLRFRHGVFSVHLANNDDIEIEPVHQMTVQDCPFNGGLLTNELRVPTLKNAVEILADALDPDRQKKQSNMFSISLDAEEVRN